MLESLRPVTFYLSQNALQFKNHNIEKMPDAIFETSKAFTKYVSINPLKPFFGGFSEKTAHASFKFPDRRGAPQILNQEIVILPSAKARIREQMTASLASVAPSNDGDIAVIQKMIPSVVRINVETAQEKERFGSGIIVEPTDIIPFYRPRFGEYFILTNNHVAEDAAYMSVMLPNGHEIHAETVESKYHTKLLDKGMDIALVRIIALYILPTAKIGNPNELLPGQTIYTAGYPRALPRISITKGIISNPHQETGSLSEDIQSDAPINPGNSGGPSFNQAGKVVGLNTYTLRNAEDMTFTKPIDKQIEALRTLWNFGIIIRGALNFKVEDFSLNDRKKTGFPEDVTGAKVKEVKQGSLAERADLKVGDIISCMEVRKNGSAVKTLNIDIKDGYEAEGVIKRWAANLSPGTKVHMLIWRKEGIGFSNYEVAVPVELMTL